VTLDKAIERSSKAHLLGGKLFASKRKQRDAFNKTVLPDVI